MFERRVCITAAFIAVAVSPLLLECTTVCQMANPNGSVEGRCPVRLTSVRSQDSTGIYSECVTVHVWVKADDFCKAPRIEILSPIKETIRPIMKNRKRKTKCNIERENYETRVRCDKVDMQLPQSNTSFALWELVHDCVEAEAEQVVSVSYSTTSGSCNTSYTVPDPTPDFELSVDLLTKSITVMVEPGEKVYVGLCYSSPDICTSMPNSSRVTIDPSQSRSVLLNITYLLPCVCVQAYYTHLDARRRKKCPFQNQSLADVGDVWRSFEVIPFQSDFSWKSKCPASDLQISVSLCWRQHEHFCTPISNSTLEREGGQQLIYNTSTVDKHPQMCVQFSLQGSHHVSCFFQADMSSWEVYIGPGRQGRFLYFTSFVPATFSAQLCAINERGCTPMGEVYSLTMDGKTTHTRLNEPFYFHAENLCVQVWQSDPALRGRRILCPNYTHNRCGIYPVAVLIFVVIAALVGIFIHRLTRSGAAGWLCIQKPVLLVCSSEESAHVNAVCALASILQGELSATVHMALWAISSNTQSGARTGVADLGPLPWLYGQWEAVCKSLGKVLIVWSPEAKKTYEKWRKARASTDKSQKEENTKAEPRYVKERVEVQENLKLNGGRMGKCKKEKAAGKKYCVKLCDDKDFYPQREPSTLIAPVFMAALACLEGALQEGKGEGVALVYFQGLCHSRDIPKAFRGVPRYCLPQDFSGLIQELGGMGRWTKNSKTSLHCWSRLLSKVRLIWLARQLTRRLQMLLQGKKMQGPNVTSSLKVMSDKAPSRLSFPSAANKARPRTVPEQEPLHGSLWRAEEL